MSKFFDELIEECWELDEPIPDDDTIEVAEGIYNRILKVFPDNEIYWYPLNDTGDVVLQPETQKDCYTVVVVDSEDDNKPRALVSIMGDFTRKVYDSPEDCPDEWYLGLIKEWQR